MRSNQTGKVHLRGEGYPPRFPRVLLNDLCRQYGASFRKWMLTPEGELSDIAIVLVNGQDVRHSGRLETPLSPDDEIFIFPPVAGGYV